MTKSKHEQTLDAAKAVVKSIESLEPEQQQQALQMAAQVLGIEGTTIRPQNPTSQPPLSGASTTNLTGVSAKDFLRSKRPTSDIERVACLAYYLTHAKGIPHFKGKQIDEMNTAAAQPAFNITRAIDNATRSGKLLAVAKDGNKQITPLGEDVVDALPDGEKVKALLAERKGTRKKKKKAGAKK